MKLALFIPCYIDQFYPQVGIASYELLTKLGFEVDVPTNATCCGQPIANSGFEHEAVPVYEKYVDAYAGYDFIVMPSGSCTLHVKQHYDILPQSEDVKNVRSNTIDIIEFLIQHCLDKLPQINFPHHVALHMGCHSLRGLQMGHSSEKYGNPNNNLEILMQKINVSSLNSFERQDECCGFGGTFAVLEEAISTKMGQDKIKFIKNTPAKILVSNDISCLMHLDGVAKKGNHDLKMMHIVELLNQF